MGGTVGSDNGPFKYYVVGSGGDENELKMRTPQKI